MNNPFLSDRNIFSKVTNPLKKKSETDKKQQPKGADGPIKPLQRRQQKIQAHNNYKSDKQSQTPLVSYPQKMTFGTSQQQQRRQQQEQRRKQQQQRRKQQQRRQEQQRMQGIDKKMVSNPHKSYQSSLSQSDLNDTFPYKNLENIKYGESKNPFMRDKYQSIPSRQNQILSPPQQQKFEEYRKKNNMNDFSPINPQQRLGDSQFLNIDALGDDINKFLAESKNQEQICKLLGIERTSKRQANEKPSGNSREAEFENAISFNSKSEHTHKPLANSKPLQTYKPISINQTGQTEAPKLPTVFSKQRKIQMGKTDQYVPFKPEVQRVSTDYIPTFNYVGLNLQNSTTSKQEQQIAHFNVVDKQKVQFSASKTSEVSESIDEIEVFNYSKAGTIKSSDPLSQVIAKQMAQMSINGKYRTFLSASEKVVTIRYRMQAL